MIIDDRTRPTPVKDILDVLVNMFDKLKLEHENANGTKIPCIIANGIHRAMTDKEIAKKVGEYNFERLDLFDFINHNASDKANLKYLGQSRSGIPVYLNKIVAEAELIISISTIESHGQAGFGGGLKNIVPGVAGLETIYYTHSYKHLSGKGAKYRSFTGRTRSQNKMRQLIEEAALFNFKTKNVFIINTILDPIHPLKVVAGHPIKAYDKGVEMVQKLFGFKIEKDADIVITNSTPLDADFRAGTKSMSMALNFCKKGGNILCFIRAEEGLGDLTISKVSKFKGLLLKLLPFGLVKKGIDKYGGPPDQAGGTLDIVKMAKYFRTYIYAPNIFGLPEINSLKNMGFKFFDDPQKMVKFALENIRSRSKIIFIPYGGVSFRII
ncbi:MAG: lactate racemase domain-containing protein [Promethearchaeota archaeon]